MIYFLGILLAFVFAFLFMPKMIRLSKRIGFCDRPTKRKIHANPMPLMGGVVIFISFFLVYLPLSLFVNKSIPLQTWAVFIGAILVLGIGILDDWFKSRKKEFSIWPRFLVQMLAATIVFFSGLVFHGFSNPLNDHIIVFPIWLQYIFTVLWIFGVTTVVNWSDGMDGLAGGITAICSVTLFIVALVTAQGSSALMAIVLLGSILGFLQYNKPPAKVFMGDSGATFIGFMIAVISLDGVFKQATFISLFVPVLALGVPIFDNIYVVIKRFMQKKPMYQADRSQLHYRLMGSGLSVKQVNMVIYLMSVCFCLVSIILMIVHNGIA